MRTLSTSIPPVLPLSGELSAATQRQLEAQLAEALASRPRRLLLDLSRVTFIDSSGLRVLVRCLRLATERGVPMALVGVQPRPFLIFELLGAADVFPVFATQAEAIAFLDHPRDDEGAEG